MKWNCIIVSELDWVARTWLEQSIKLIRQQLFPAECCFTWVSTNEHLPLSRFCLFGPVHVWSEVWEISCHLYCGKWVAPEISAPHKSVGSSRSAGAALRPADWVLAKSLGGRASLGAWITDRLSFSRRHLSMLSRRSPGPMTEFSDLCCPYIRTIIHTSQSLISSTFRISGKFTKASRLLVISGVSIQ